MTTFLDPLSEPNGPKSLAEVHDAVRLVAAVYKREMGWAEWHILSEAEIDDLLKRLKPIIKKWEG